MSLRRLIDNANPTRAASLAEAVVQPGAFIACPIGLLAVPGGLTGPWQQSIYQLAFEQAQAATKCPSLFERDWLGTWN
jgi:hypothetical protein